MHLRNFFIMWFLALTGAVSLFGQDFIGDVHVYIFDISGFPLEGASLEENGQVHLSNSSGLIRFAHGIGNYTFPLLYQNQLITELKISIAAGQATEVIVTVREDEVIIPGSSSADNTAAAIEAAAGEIIDTIDPNAPTGEIQGTIIHIETGEPVQGVTVVFRGINLEVVSDENGEFEVDLPAGKYSFSFIHPDFSIQTVNDAEIKTGETVQADIELTPAAVELASVSVFAAEDVRVQGGIASILDETRNSGNILSIIGKEQIGRSGDSDAAGALKRVTGITIMDGKFVYVRGMGERYSCSYLNDRILPSPEMDRRVVPLDLFPSKMLESIAVQKTYSPELNGDFGGGAVMIRSLGIPRDRYKRRLKTTINASIGYNLGTSLTKALAHEAGLSNVLGVDLGGRKLPENIENSEYRIFLENTSGEGYTEKEIEEFAESLSRTWEPVERTIPLDYSGSISLSDKIEFKNGGNLGINGSFSYSNSWDQSEQVIAGYTPGGSGIYQTTDYTSICTGQDIDIGGMLDMVYQHSDSLEFRSTSLLVRATDAETEITEGYYYNDDRDLQRIEQSWVEQTLFNQSLGGMIGFGESSNTQLNWDYAFSFANLYEPDHHYFTYTDESSDLGYADGVFDEDERVWWDHETGAMRWWSTKTDIINEGSLDFTIPVFWFNGETADYIDIGLQGSYLTRKTDTRRFAYTYVTPSDSSVLGSGADEIFTDDNIGYDTSDGEFIHFVERTVTTDNYAASHLLGAGYLAGDFLFLNRLRTKLGARAEYSRFFIQSVDLISGEYNDPTILSDFHVLPALSFTLSMFEKSQFRFGGSMTVNRPQIHELAPVKKYGAPGEATVEGNPDLVTASIYNADIRWETYFLENEFFSVGCFYKYLQNPIEVVCIPGAEELRTYQNVPVGHLAGAELEWQIQFRIFSDLIRRNLQTREYSSLEQMRQVRKRAGFWAGILRDLYTGGNIAYIYSIVDYQNISSDNTNSRRPLQGQAPYVINLSLGYKNSVSWRQDKKTHTNITLNYNITGPSISSVGTNNIDDFYTQPFHSLDLVVKHQFNEYFSLSLKAKNIINPYARETVGKDSDGEVIQEYKKERSFSISGTLEL